MLRVPLMNDTIRKHMQETWRRDDYRSKQLTDDGHAAFRHAMSEAIQNGTIETLQITVASFPAGHYRPNKAGTIPSDAGRRLSHTDYLTLYNVGFAAFLKSLGETHGVITRYASAYDPRGECLEYEGLAIDLNLVLDGYRKRYHGPNQNPTAFTLPIGPNCHHGLRQLTAIEKEQGQQPTIISGIPFIKFY